MRYNIGLNSFFTLLILGLGGIIFCTSCGKDRDIPDVSDINVDLNIQRFEKDLFALDTLNLATSVKTLEEKYPVFSELYFRQVVPLKRKTSDSLFLGNLNGFINYPSIRTLYDTTLIVYPKLEKTSKELQQAFQFYKYYFPQKEVPNIYTFISEYTYQTFIFPDKGKDAIGIGLDMFLGKDYPYRKYIPENPSFSAYLTRAFNQEHITKKVMETLIDDVVGLSKGNQLLDIMIHNGKKMYLLDLVLPTTNDTIKWELTPQQLAWCQQNELGIWTHLLNEDLLYSTDNKKLRKLVNPSPQGPSNMPPEAPGRTANFIGYKIIQSYLKRNPDTTPQDLIAENDAQKILDKSRYRPR